MKKTAPLLCFLIISLCLCAQTSTSQQMSLTTEIPSLPNPVETIMNESNGNITIDIPEEILIDIQQGVAGMGNLKQQNLKHGVNHLTGYRIQVFSDGRNQGTLESRAKARGNLILNRFPKYKGQIYTFSKSPNWYCRIGNFRTSEDANNAITELKKAFPGFAGEMRIVKSPIVIIKQ